MEEEQQLRMSDEEIDLLIEKEMKEDNINFNPSTIKDLPPERRARYNWIKTMVKGLPNEQLRQINIQLEKIEEMKNETMRGLENQLIRNPNYNISDEELETLSSLDKLKTEIIKEANMLKERTDKKRLILGRLLIARDKFAEDRAVFQLEKRLMKPEGKIDIVLEEPNNALNRVSKSRVIPKNIVKVNRDEMAIFKPISVEESKAIMEREQRARRARGL